MSQQASGSVSNAALSGGPRRDMVVAAVAGAFLGLCLLKFGNPIILDHLIEAPAGWDELRVQPWPLKWGYVLLLPVTILGACTARLQTTLPRWILWMPLGWLAWQVVSATQTVDARLTQVTLLHFAACVACFYIGLLALGRVSRLTGFWIGLLIGFVGVLWAGLGQHYGGLEATRRFLYEMSSTQPLPPELIERIEKGRIFGTLVYPNAFAGVIVLLLPVLLVFVWNLSARLGQMGRMVAAGLLAYVAIACLVWSGSKAGWLIVLMQAAVIVLHLPLQKRIRIAILGAALVFGLGGFALKYSDYFQRGATSAGARLDYWRAAVLTFRENPFLGSGPGTFSREYAKLKPASAEMAKLTHNDYLEQASDSGAVGFLTHLAWVASCLMLGYRNAHASRDWLRLALWVGLVGWALQGLTEFRLYIPALAWTGFVLLGWLAGLAGQGPLTRQYR